MHAPRAPDIHRFDDWPPKERCPPWDYEGCRTEDLPLIGHTYLLHQWRNPSHSDVKTYFSQPRTVLERLLFFLRHMKPTTPSSGHSEPKADAEPVHDEEAGPNRGTIGLGSAQSSNLALRSPDPSCYVFLRTPKKLGDQLVADDRATPEAWVCIHISYYISHYTCSSVTRRL